MDYLKQFDKDFWTNKIPIRTQYNSEELAKSAPDVIFDLNTDQKPVSVACLPIAKQIAITNQNITLKLPRIGDLFIGLLHQSIIDGVKYTLHNHTESITVDGTLRTLEDKSIWVFTKLPVPLISVGDYENIYLEVSIYLNNNYNLQALNQEVFKAYYGYFNQSIQYRTISQTNYDIDLFDDQSILKMICGF